MKRLTINEWPRMWRLRLETLGRAAVRHSCPSAIVGGCVRDLVLGLEPKDWDVVVEGQPSVWISDVASSLAARVVEHPRFMTLTLHFSDGTHLDIATARKETYVKPGSLPTVQPSSLSVDALRRDFSANALYFLLSEGTLFDPTGGVADMGQKRLRVLHDISFIDDPTRLFRAARYAARYGWTVDKHTLDLIQSAVAARVPQTVSLVRLRHELFRLLEEEDPIGGLRLAWQWGLWTYWDPRWEFTEELGARLKSLPRQSPPAHRLAVLLSDHPNRAEEILTRFSTPVDLKKQVSAHLANFIRKFNGPIY
ncbi:MAG: CCA tRNA nucleotidyltransferase [Elusimicrobia bacterium]|nr:CCA tRNA nucleotidyltransferase [Elusimicrobiota bacterium]